jgi:K(+)-stimulated pyrophosphate-energized sodium pump
MKNIAEVLKAYPKVKLKVGGYTDNTGKKEDNLKLSQERANTVKAGLVGLGVAADRLDAEGYGQEHPVADNATEEGKAKNRRIDIRITEK